MMRAAIVAVVRACTTPPASIVLGTLVIATRATVTVRRSRQTLKVAVADNGRGISDRDLASAGSLGLIGMRERAVLLRGTFEARRRRPRGTIVTFTVPLADSTPGTRVR